MNISPETKPISEIFSISGSDKYAIPIYQRSYSWDFNQIETLFKDINDEDNGYYIGNLLITRNGNNVLEIVDGQQRLTTIALMLIAIYEFVNNGFESKHDQDIGFIKKDISRQLLIEENIITPRYTLLEEDHKIFINLIKKNFFREDVFIPKNKKFSKKYLKIYQLISDEFYNNFDALKNFYQKKLLNIKILRITVNNLSDAFSVFSSLNSKGMPLTLIDLLKNEFLRFATTKKSADESLFLWNKLLAMFENDNDINTNNVTQFLLYNYDTYHSDSTSSITKNNALNEYIGLIKDNPFEYVNTLIKRANWFLLLKDEKENFHTSYEVNSIIHSMSYLDVAQSFPLLMYILDNQSLHQISDVTLIKILKNIRQFFIIRNVTQRPKASNIRAMFLNLNRKIRSEKLLDNEIFLIISKTIKDTSDSIEEFKNKLKEDGIFDKNPSTTRFLLIQLETKYTKYFNKSNLNSLEHYVTNPKKKTKQLQWTIEHILPQGILPDHWMFELKNENQEDLEELQDKYVHKLGNLTLTTYNSELGQLSFIDKRDKKVNGTNIGFKLPLYLNESIKGNGDWDEQVHWTPSDIDRRTDSLIEDIIELFEFNHM
jgi:uncharacterized protein with ParB-like and HNH nuclease domain